ncbi:MAG: peptide deformylase [Oscillospiraceae bacterium]|jgi:peptide deformylase|nr:peptide deformylase [Oscillospiraceae bacterium]
MVRQIVKDAVFLSQKSEPATQKDLPVVLDLLDTLKAHRDGCVGMAANMIGERKRIIAIDTGVMDVAMINPVILKRSEPYETSEGCLSHSGQRKALRYRKIQVEFFDVTFRKHRRTYTDFIAQIIQHEVDHCDGVII